MDSPPVQLQATSDSGLPVQYYVAFGPARIGNGQLIISDVPTKARFLIEVKVVAWQFGSGVEPLVKTAAPVERTFKLIQPVRALFATQVGYNYSSLLKCLSCVGCMYMRQIAGYNLHLNEWY